MLAYSAPGFCCIVRYTLYYNEKQISLLCVRLLTKFSLLTVRMATHKSFYMVRENELPSLNLAISLLDSKLLTFHDLEKDNWCYISSFPHII